MSNHLMNQTGGDVVILLKGTLGPFLPIEWMLAAASIVHERLGVEVLLISSENLDEEHAREEICRRATACSRVVVVPVGVEPVPVAEVLSTLWFASLQPPVTVFTGEPFSARQIGLWLRGFLRQIEPGSRALELLTTSDLPERQLERLAAAAYWASQDGATVRIRALRPAAPIQTNGLCLPWFDCDHFQKLHWNAEGGAPSTGNPAGMAPPSWQWVTPSSLASWLIERYLSALQSRPLPLPCDQPVSDRVRDWSRLNALVAEEKALLPDQVAERLDSVSPRSMGSASLRYDANGRVPWDEIWTSFCDLALAGGPPHRGRLLESVDRESVVAAPEQYQRVVDELRRGIGLASGLPTRECDQLGWVGVECTDEHMAAWMLRAILVENVTVRREENVLYLPAGPHFRIEKEIKNVITSVAKTAHYWQAHLRTRQPPNPL